MLHAPRVHEERDFAPRFTGVRRMDVHHDAGVVPDGLRHAPVPKEQGNQLREQSRLGETHAHRHRVPDYWMQALPFGWTEVALVRALCLETGLVCIG